MEDKTSTLRLIYPQWQGGIVNHWMPDLPADDASRGYYLGAQLLNILAPPSPQKTVEVPISLDINDRETDLGISARKVILKQTKAALELLHENAPEKIVTLGGECSVSVVPFTYLAAKYPEKVAAIRSEEYYVNMMRAWYFATALAKQYEKILPFLEEQRMDIWTHNKTIQKSIESYRITQEQKDHLRTLRIKK